MSEAGAGETPANGASAERRASFSDRVGTAATVLIAVEAFAYLVRPLPSPTGALASLLVRVTPGPFATAFLETFRGFARPLTIVAAFTLLSVTLALIVPGVWRRLGRGARDRRSAAAATRAADDAAPSPTSRRSVLALLGVLGVGLGAATLLRGRTTTPAATLAPELRASSPLPAITAAQDAAARVPGLSPVLTPVDEFFRIDTSIGIPRVDRDSWRLRVHGRVDREVILDFDQLVALGLEEHDATIACVSNEVGGDLVGTARWTGVPLRRVLELAGVRPDADQLVGRAVDGWTAGMPVEAAQVPDALVAVGMNGVELPARHGYPVRLIVPGLFGYVSATKWLTELELTRWQDYDAYWIRRGWARRGPVKTMTRIDVPRTRVTEGAVRIAGVAWAPRQGVDSVEVRISGGAWRTATCSEPLSGSTWRQWWLDVPLTQGTYVLEARAVDTDGAVQPEGPKGVLPDGAEGWHRIGVTVVAA
jgi:DMSO/TMAO reductase YedYZ molybdopterin-dependent catalytic subunit